MTNGLYRYTQGRYAIGNCLLAMLIFFFLGAGSLFAQDSGTISGTVKDGSGNAVIGANITVVGQPLGASTDVDGAFVISNVPSGSYTVRVEFIGYTTVTKQVVVSPNGSVRISAEMIEATVGMNAITVTGTRSKGRTAIQSAVPVDAFAAEIVERQGNGDLTETLKNIVPSFSATPLTGDGSAFVRPTSLRGLPPDNALVLVNSKRRHRSALIAHFGAAMNVGAHAVDVGMVPSIGLKTVEVLRDGASAQYGSDAIAGVMNFILKDARQGMEIQAQVGQWYPEDYADNGSERDFKIAGNVGLPLTDKGFLNISAEYVNNPELSRGIQHASAVGVSGALDPAMNWGRPESSGFRSVFNAAIQLNNSVQAYAFGNFADTYGNYSFFYRPPGRDDALDPLPIDPNDPSQGNFCWCDEFPAGFTPRFEGFQTDLATVFGLKGTLDNGIIWDLSGTYGRNRINYKLNGSLNASWGPDSQFDFEPGDLMQEDLNFNLDLAKEVVENVNLAGGLEFRRESYTMFEGDRQSWDAGPWAGVGTLIDPQTGANYSSPGLAANGFAGTAPDVAGTFDGSNVAVYLDAEWDASEDLLFAAAVRYEDFSEFGNTTNGKLAARYNVSDKLTLRGAVSTGFRAPTPGQANVTTITTSFDGATLMQVQEGTVRPTDPLAVSLGGKALTPEEAVNISLGLASQINSNISFSFDFYQIEVDNRIIKSRSLPIVDPNFSELAFYTNSLNTQTRGFDLVVAATTSSNTDISLAYNFNETDVLSQELVNGVRPVSSGTVFNIENNLPKHRASATVVQNFEAFSAMARANFYGGTIDERGAREVVGAETLIDIELGYNVNPNVRLIAGANNLLDNYPDEIETRISQGMPYPRRTPIGYHGGMGYLRVVFSR